MRISSLRSLVAKKFILKGRLLVNGFPFRPPQEHGRVNIKLFFAALRARMSIFRVDRAVIIGYVLKQESTQKINLSRLAASRQPDDVISLGQMMRMSLRNVKISNVV